MAYMFKGKQFDINTNLGAVDSSLTLHCDGKFQDGLSCGRREQIKNKLVTYTIFDNSGWTNYGDCGRIHIQYLEDHKTRLLIDENKPTEKDLTTYIRRITFHPSEQGNAEEKKSQAYERLIAGRINFLQDICLALANQLQGTALQPNKTPTDREKNKKAQVSIGRPLLKKEQAIDRLAVTYLIEMLQAEDHVSMTVLDCTSHSRAYVYHP